MKIRQSLSLFNPRHYYCRKRFYALPVQAVCDDKSRFRYMSFVAVGSTHDSVAFAMSSLNGALVKGVLVRGFWLAGDAALLCAQYILTSFLQF